MYPIDKYFKVCPTTQPTTGLKRVRSSPEMRTPDKKICQKDPGMSTPTSAPHDTDSGSTSSGSLISQIDELLDKKMAHLEAKLENLATKEDIKILQQKMSKLEDENQVLKKEICDLKKANENIDNILEGLETKLRSNNVIIKGLHFKEEEILPDLVSKFFKEVLGLKSDTTVQHAQPIGTKESPNRLILCTLPSKADVMKVLRSGGKLKGTNLSLQQDLPVGARKKRSKLLALRRGILEMKRNVRVNVSVDSLYVNNVQFKWSDSSGLLFGREDGCMKLSEILQEDVSPMIAPLLAANTPMKSRKEPPISK